MLHSIEYVAHDDFILINIRDELHVPDLERLFSDAAHVMKEYNCYRTLSDYREAKLGLSTMDLFSLAKIFVEQVSAAGIEMHKIKRAVVVSSDLADFVFYETTARNRGHQVRIFQDSDKAKGWLLS